MMAGRMWPTYEPPNERTLSEGSGYRLCQYAVYQDTGYPEAVKKDCITVWTIGNRLVQPHNVVERRDEPCGVKKVAGLREGIGERLYMFHRGGKTACGHASSGCGTLWGVSVPLMDGTDTAEGRELPFSSEYYHQEAKLRRDKILLARECDYHHKELSVDVHREQGCACGGQCHSGKNDRGGVIMRAYAESVRARQPPDHHYNIHRGS